MSPMVSLAASIQVLTSNHADGRSVPAEIYVSGPLTESVTRNVVNALDQHEITKGTIYLDSEGGDLSASIMFGEFIRRTGFNTAIGRQGQAYGQPSPGSCQSACVMSFAAGKYRFADPRAYIGIHRFYSHSAGPEDLALGQAVSANITSYLVRMGVSPVLFERMVNAGAGMQKLSIADAESLGLVNNGQLSPKWEIRGKDGQIYLYGMRESWMGTGEINVSCSINRPMTFTAFYGAEDNTKFISQTTRHTSVRLDGSFIGVTPSTGGNPSVINNALSTSFLLSKPLASQISVSRSIGFAWHPSASDIFYGFDIPTSDQYELVHAFFNHCISL